MCEPLMDQDITENKSNSFSKRGKRSFIRNKRQKKFGKQVFKVNKLNLDTLSNKTHGFAIIDRRYTQQIELMPGLVTYKRPITGTIEMYVHLDLDFIKSILHRAIRRWSETVSYHEIRSMKSVIGSTASEEIDKSFSKAAEYIATRIVVIINTLITDVKSLTLYMEEIGISNIIVPKYLYDIIHLVNSAKRIHRIDTSDQSMIRCKLLRSTATIELINVLQKENKVVSFEEALFNLSTLGTQSKFGDTIAIDNFACFNESSPQLCNAMLIQTDYEQFSLGNDVVMLGYTTTQKDISLSYLIGLSFSGSTLPKGVIDTFTYLIERKRCRGPMTNFFVNEYLNINDVYVSPQVNNPSDEAFDENNIDNSMNVKV